jgi:hypothetical protein
MPTKNRFQDRVNEASVRAVIRHYEQQTDDHAVAEDEAAFQARGQTVMVVPRRLVTKITKLISREKAASLRKPTSRAQRKSKTQKNPRAARG